MKTKIAIPDKEEREEGNGMIPGERRRRESRELTHGDGGDRVADEEPPLLTTEPRQPVLTDVSHHRVADHGAEVDGPVEPVEERLLLLAVPGVPQVELVRAHGRDIGLDAARTEGDDVNSGKEEGWADIAGDRADHHHDQPDQVNRAEHLPAGVNHETTSIENRKSYQNRFISTQICICDVTTEQWGDVAEARPGGVLDIRVRVGIVQLGLLVEVKKSWGVTIV